VRIHLGPSEIDGFLPVNGARKRRAGRWLRPSVVGSWEQSMPNVSCISNLPAVHPLFRASWRFGRTIGIALATGLFCSLPTGAQAPSGKPAIPAESPDPSELKVCIGKYPFSGVEGHSLLDVPQVRLRLRTLLGPKDAGTMKRWNVTSLIAEHGGWLLAHGCQPHNCAGANSVLAINLSDYSNYVCFAPDRKPLKFAATGKKPIEKSRHDSCPGLSSDPGLSEALLAFRQIFSSPH